MLDRNCLSRTVEAVGRRRDRPSGKSRVATCCDEWLYAWIKAEAVRKKISISAQAELMLNRYAEGKIT